MNVFPETEWIETCRKEDGYKDKCLQLPIKGCEGCYYRGFKMVEIHNKK